MEDEAADVSSSSRRGSTRREVAEVPYEVPSVPRGETTYPVCRQSFKLHHRVKLHMGVHRGEKFPCGKCGKVLASKIARDTGGIIPSHVWKVKLLHALYVRSLLLVLSPCASNTRPNMGLIPWCLQADSFALFVAKVSKSKRHGVSTSHIVLIILTARGLIFVGLLGVPWQTIPSPGFAT